MNEVTHIVSASCDLPVRNSPYSSVIEPDSMPLPRMPSRSRQPVVTYLAFAMVTATRRRRTREERATRLLATLLVERAVLVRDAARLVDAIIALALQILGRAE